MFSSSGTNYRFDVLTWNQEVQWGYITIKLYGKNQSAKATIDQYVLNMIVLPLTL
jgi:hypothetical protein